MKIYYTPEFLKNYKKLDKNLKTKVKLAIKKLAEGYAGKKLKYELRDYYSIRVSDIRVIYKIVEGDIILITCGHRKKVYG